jgi:hypothetical protein
LIPSRRTAPFNYRLPPATPGDDIILLLGQSNMVGKATDYNSTDDPSDARIRAFTFAGSTISPATEPIQHRDSPALGGPGLAFGRQWLTLTPANRNIMLVAGSAGGTGFSLPDSNAGSLTWDLAQPNDANNLYYLAVAQAKAAITASGAGSRIIGILINIGGTDALNHVTQAGFDAYIDAFVPAIRAALGLPNLPIVFGPSRPDAIAGNTWYQGVNASQKTIPGRISRTAYIPGAVGDEFYKTTDAVHFNQVAQRQMGVAYANALTTILNGAPTLTAPTVSLSGTAGSTDMTVQWTRPAGIVGFRVQYKATSSGTWLDAGTNVDTSANSRYFSGLSAATSYDFRVASIDGSLNVGSYSATFTVSTAGGGGGGSLLLDTYSGALAAYSLRRINTSYTGALVKVRRSSDNTTADIGYDGSNNLDTAALATFVGANSAYIDTWYDQSGSSRNVAQATQTLQPMIVNAGTNVTFNSKIAHKFDGTDDRLTRAALGMWAAGTVTASMVFGGAGPAGTQCVVQDSSSASSALYRVLRSSTAAINVQGQNDAATATWASTSAGDTSFDGNAHQLFYVDNGSSISTWRDNAAKHAAITATKTGTATFNMFLLGANQQNATVNNFYQGYMQEVVIWPTDLTAGRSTIQTDQKTYWGTP